MTALAAAANRKTRGASTALIGYPVATNVVIWKGAIVMLNAGGFLTPATDTAALLVVGVADETVNNNPGANGAKICKVRSGEEYLFACTSITQAMVGTNMVVVDDNTVDDVAGATNDRPVGRLTEFVSTTQGYVFIPAGGSPAAVA